MFECVCYHLSVHSEVLCPQMYFVFVPCILHFNLRACACAFHSSAMCSVYVLRVHGVIRHSAWQRSSPFLILFLKAGLWHTFLAALFSDTLIKKSTIVHVCVCVCACISPDAAHSHRDFGDKTPHPSQQCCHLCWVSRT